MVTASFIHCNRPSSTQPRIIIVVSSSSYRNRIIWRRFVWLVVASVCALSLWFHPPSIAQSPAEIRGVWLTSNDMPLMSDRQRLYPALSQLSQLNFNTVYPVIWNSGYVNFPSAVAQRAGIQPFIRRGTEGQDILADLIGTAHQQQLAVIPWFEFGFMTPTTSELALNHPQWLTQRRDGSKTLENAAGEVVWLNPLRPDVQEFFTNLVLELVNNYDIDGIQFDDHTSFPVEFGYDSYTLGLYQAETGQGIPSSPHESAWKRWRANKLADFMEQLKQTVKRRKPNLIFSVSPTTYLTAYNNYLQDWVNWAERGIADEILVQVYRHDLQSFRHELAKPEIRAVQQKVPMGIGILTGLRTTPVSMQAITAQVQVARGLGLGLSFFSYESLWSSAPEPESSRQAMFASFFGNRRASRRTTPASQPPAQSPTYIYQRSINPQSP